SQIARFQGSASLGLEIVSLNFLYGNVLVVQTGYYSERLKTLCESSKRRLEQIKNVQSVNWNELNNVEEKFDWVFACPTETSIGLKVPITDLRKLADQVGAKLALDATASIGLEGGHELADVAVFSSCKGLFGLTGAAFIVFNDGPKVEVDSFYLDVRSHLEKKMTGPYHAIASLWNVLKDHSNFREGVVINKDKFLKKCSKDLVYDSNHQPLLCTFVKCNVTSSDQRAVLYKPRGIQSGSVVCHLGEAHLGSKAKGQILEVLNYD
ncbi:MAG: aminotransferase class V-fold PLP-dependent enzyme, partial [Bdellovibrionales bacterium]|nr:aminotransferase class V-fold PLP-dependent enzyme [Bdellovibrionales bacterium]